ncbi:chorismate-binding protein [Gulosibacter bifidus]|uniref:aminodeoxychorismate synthase n=1 Tax=Gulosibacter bifidus TaxID=272239 RepID=A0ABW5RI79_9MICO|nr:chorismate-binding protein [Gulosibacter bifidus]
MTRLLCIDFHDSFTYNLRDLVVQASGILPEVVPFDDPRLTAAFLAEFDAIILSPGPGDPNNPADTGRIPQLIRAYQGPVLGVCFGHQILALLSGATVGRITPQHGYCSTLRVPEATNPGAVIVRDGQQVVRYHSLAITGGTQRLIVDAVAEDGSIQAIRVPDRRWWGVQFHPESVKSQDGIALIKRWMHAAALTQSVTSQTPSVTATAPQPVASDQPAPPAGRNVPLHWREIPSPRRTAPEAFTAIANGASAAFWLDSAALTAGARWSFLGLAGEVLTADAHEVTVRDADGRVTAREPGGAIAALRRRDITGVGGPDGVPLLGGWVGALGYEARREFGFATTKTPNEPEAMWLRASRYLAFDHECGRVWAIAEVQGPAAETWRPAAAWVDAITQWMQTPETETEAAPRLPAGQLDRIRQLPEHRAADDARYRALVARAQESLHAGDSYEVCLTTTAELDIDLTPTETLALYLQQRAANAAPYAAYLRAFDTAIMCSSPERFLQIRDGFVETKPIKGTVARSEDAATDAQLREWLQHDAKTGAELLMIVDLLRNDLSRVCVPGSVVTPDAAIVETYATVHQLLGRVCGQLPPEANPWDAIAAAFPGGSMTGAPKERTCDIIDELESRARGFYAGTLGYVSGKTADLNIIIRSLTYHAGTLRAGAGGAVVLASTPEGELDEMLVKLRAAIP